VVLPTEDQTWPPALFDPIAHKHRLWAAWYSGDADQLSWAYYNLGANSNTGRAFFRTTGEASIPQPRPGQYRGGLLGSVDRYFWGQATPPGEKRSKIHVPVAGDLASMSADLLFAKRPRFEVPGVTGENPTVEWCEQRFDDDLHGTLLEAGELCSALGGVYLRSIYDRDVSDRPLLDVVHADAAIPEFRYGKLVSVIFWRVLQEDGDDVHRHLEQHDLTENAIYHGVYVGNQWELGSPVNIADYPELQPVAASLDSSNAIRFPDLPKDASTVTYMPNMRPNRVWRDVHAAHALGRSDYAGVEGLMDSFDETYSAWVREIRLAKTRLIVPNQYLDQIGPGKGAVFEPDREVLSPMNFLAGSNDPSNGIIANQFKIRWQEYLNTLNKAKEMIVESAGYSPQTFGENSTGSGTVTATEIEDRQRRTLLTRAKKLNYVRPAVAGAMYAQMWIDKTVFGRNVDPVRPVVTFPDAVLPSMQELAQTAVALANAEAASKETLVQLIHPDWTPDQVDEEVQRIRSEAGFDILGRARISLQGPQNSTETVGQEVQQIADDVKVHTLSQAALNPEQELNA
jgi:hypothetical protein